ncbi:MAG: aminoacetone oxidase family FAD-binding enzyme [Ezakiella sp.]|nr:aminoacetone oxidase family FAD-binding enzyme [Ezakiella sp.]
MKIAIIGAGVSGVTCAIDLKSRGYDVKIFEKNDRALKKLLTTGNGRCNYFNKVMSRDNFHGNDAFLDVFFKAYEDSDFKKVLFFLESIGMQSTIDSRGRYYPMSLQASSVVEAMLNIIDNLGIEIELNSEIVDIEYSNGFNIFTKDRGYFFDRVVLAAGSQSYPNLGTDGGSYRLADSLGHKRTKILPGIGSLICDVKYNRELKGLRLEGKINYDGLNSPGDILFTENGISGSAVFESSSYILRNNIKDINIDFMPQVSKEELGEILYSRVEKFSTLFEVFNGLVHKRLYRVILKMMQLKPEMDSKILNINQAVNLLKSFPIGNIKGGSWANSQVTVGGIDFKDIDYTLESKLIKGLYFCGECLDVDGDCGGYNITWALISALNVSNNMR